MLKTDMHYLTGCVFMDEAVFHISIEAPYGCSVSGTEELLNCSNWKWAMSKQ